MLIRRLGCGLFIVYFSVSMTACVTSSGSTSTADAAAKPPVISEKMPAMEAAQAGVQFGGETLQEVKRLAKVHHQGQAIGQAAAKILKKEAGSLGDRELLNAGNLFASMPVPFDTDLFYSLVNSTRPLARQLGWQLAASKPSAGIATAIDRELTQALAENETEIVLIPTMANAVTTNRLKSAYTFVRQGLLTKGDEEFAQAMMALNPERASEDFMDYLSQASADELRQLTLSSVNLYTSVAILKHFQKFPPNMANAHFDHLFLYAVSRNTGLAELSQTVIEGYVPSHTDILAMALAKHPAWVQIAYLENARRRMNPKEGLLLTELKKVTSERDVVEEIDEAKF